MREFRVRCICGGLDEADSSTVNHDIDRTQGRDGGCDESLSGPGRSEVQSGCADIEAETLKLLLGSAR
jgi:hypothetical protein